MSVVFPGLKKAVFLPSQKKPEIIRQSPLFLQQMEKGMGYLRIFDHPKACHQVPCCLQFPDQGFPEKFRNFGRFRCGPSTVFMSFPGRDDPAHIPDLLFLNLALFLSLPQYRGKKIRFFAILCGCLTSVLVAENW